MWIKGNLHCHTNESDGDTEPSEVCRFYANHGYHFLSITDHSRRVDPETVDPHGLLLIAGEEMGTYGADKPDAPLHVNGIGIGRHLPCETAATMVQAIQGCIDAVTANGGIAQINHPNWHYAFDHTTIAQTRGAQLLEVFNGHPDVNNLGDQEHISVEAMWDHLLTSGMLIYATAVDDAHHYVEFAPNKANPLRGWIWVRVERPSVDDVMTALRRGDFYASTGVELEDVIIGRNSLRVIVRKLPGVTYVTKFIGSGGRVLEESKLTDSSFAFDGKQGYVRAKVISSDGKTAWTQPAFTSGLD